MSKKRHKRQVKRKEPNRRVAGGYSELAHPDDSERYQDQLAVIYGWLLETLERAEGDDERAAHAARALLQALFLTLGEQSLRVALADKESPTKQWAGKILATIFVSIGKYAGKVRIDKPYRRLMGTNSAFRAEKEKLGRAKMELLFPVPIAVIVQRELKKAESYQWRALVLKKVFARELHDSVFGPLHDRTGKCVGKGLRFRRLNRKQKEEKFEQMLKKRDIPQEYWPAMDLPEFSVKSEPRWWEFLWPLVKEKSDQRELLNLAQQKFSAAKERYFSSL